MIRLACELGAAVLALWSVPLALELLLLSVASAMPARRRACVAGEPVALWAVVPAHNEERLIAECVRSLRADGADGLLQVLVVAHNCTDGTTEQAAAAGAEVLPLQDDGSGGKGSALEAGFRVALERGADAVLVIDADSVVSPGLIASVRDRLHAGAAALQCRYVARNAAANTRTRLLSLALTGMNVVRPLGRARLGLSAGMFGNGFALTADTLRRVPYEARSVVEDLEYHLLLLRAGLRVDFAEEAEVRGELPEGTAAAGTQRARWEGGRARMRREWAAPLAAEVLRGRLRMLEPLLDLLAVPLATGAGALVFGLVLSMAAGSLLLGGYFLLGLSGVLLYVFQAARLGPDPAGTLRALLSVPGFLWFKLRNRQATRQNSRRASTWVRTERNEAPDRS